MIIIKIQLVLSLFHRVICEYRYHYWLSKDTSNMRSIHYKSNILVVFLYFSFDSCKASQQNRFKTTAKVAWLIGLVK